MINLLYRSRAGPRQLQKLCSIKRTAPKLVRFNSNHNGKKEEKDELISKKDKENQIQFDSIKSKSSSASPAPFDATNNHIGDYLSKDKKPYIPKLKHERLTYDYPGLPNQDDFTAVNNNLHQKTNSRWSRYFPKILTVIVGIWGAYTIKVWFFQPEEGAKSQNILDQDSFHKFRITHKEKIDEEHYLIELVPKYTNWQYSYLNGYNEKCLWNGDRIWSVEIKQPEIMVVRSYTPLPLYFMKSEYTRSGEKKPLLKVINNENNDYDKNGTMCIYVKRYKDGEVSKYITSKEVGDELEIRGPQIEYKFPYHPLNKFYSRPIFKDLPSKMDPLPNIDKIKRDNNLPDHDNMVFYAAGTGISPILQVLFSRNPFRGFVEVHYSAKKPGELGPIERFLFFLEKLDRIKLHCHYDNDPSNPRLDAKCVKAPGSPGYVSPLRSSIEKDQIQSSSDYFIRNQIILDKETEKKNESEEKQSRTYYRNAIEEASVTSKWKKRDPSLAIVCGPDGYINYLAGTRDDITKSQGPVTGLLGKKGWDNSNVYKL